MSEQNQNTDLIQCGDHKWAPWSIVCKHLADGECKEWVPLESSSPEVDFDWTCPDCIPSDENPSDENPPDLDNLRAVCIHCVRKLRKEYDPNYEE